MQLSTLIAAASIASTAIALPSTSNIGKRSVDQNLFDEFLRAIKISQAAYTTDCAKPIGLEKKLTIADTATSCDGFVLRDDERKEIIVCFCAKPLRYKADNGIKGCFPGDKWYYRCCD